MNLGFNLHGLHELLQGYERSRLPRPQAWGNGLRLDFLVSQDDHVRDLLELGLADLVADLLLPGVQANRASSGVNRTGTWA